MSRALAGLALLLALAGCAGAGVAIDAAVDAIEKARPLIEAIDDCCARAPLDGT